MNINPFIDLVATIINLYTLALIISIILNWLIYFDIVNKNQSFVKKLNEVLYRLTDPVLRFIRNYIPTIASIDFSPLILFLVLRFLVSAMYTYFYV